MSETLPTKTHDGFHLSQTKIELPLDNASNASLDPKLQMDLLLCHLFVNAQRCISDITRIGEDYESVVRTLLEQGVIADRRQMQGRPPDGIERR
jgi:hypothetical protein